MRPRLKGGTLPDRAMRSPDVEAEITLRSTDCGGRATGSLSGYRPQHRILPGYLTSGTHTYAEGKSLAPGATTVGTIAFLTPEAYPHCLDQGDIVEISEGSRVVGRALILRVLNPLLQRPPGVHLAVPEYPDWTDESSPLPENWMPLDSRTAAHLLVELRRELCPGHLLFDRQLRAVGQSRPQDDVLFESLDGDGAVYVVHLTWNPETNPNWPHTTRFETMGHFFRRWPRDELDE